MLHNNICTVGFSKQISAPSVEFPTNSLEMNAVANIFDMNSDGFIDYYEFVSALHPSRDPYRKTLDADQINEEARRVCAKGNEKLLN